MKTTASKPVAKKTAAPKAATSKKVSEKMTKADNRKLIDGVGPKLEQLLIGGGFTSFTAIANAEVADLQKVLDAAGSRYKMHNPTSWPLQARFARDGKFEALKSWQEKNNAQKA